MTPPLTPSWSRSYPLVVRALWVDTTCGYSGPSGCQGHAGRVDTTSCECWPWRTGYAFRQGQQLNLQLFQQLPWITEQKPPNLLHFAANFASSNYSISENYSNLTYWVVTIQYCQKSAVCKGFLFANLTDLLKISLVIIVLILALPEFIFH